LKSARGIDLAKEDEPVAAGKEQLREIEQLRKRLDMLDERLDNIDSLVTAVAERIVKQPITLNLICPSCGKKIEITLVGNEKPT
jgi:hypothetical protein